MMNKKINKTQYLQTGSLLDWVFIISCFWVGAVTFHIAFSPAQWKDFARKNHLVILPAAEQSTQNVISINSIQREISTNSDPYIPTLIGPLNGAQYISSIYDNQEITLKWKTISLGLRPEIEIRRFDDPYFKTHPHVTRSGAIASLSDGKYRWRVRTYNKMGQYSDWSQPRVFIIEESAHGPPAISLAKPDTKEPSL